MAAALGTAADARTIFASGSSHLAAGDGDVLAAAHSAAADARTLFATGSVHRAAGDGDGFGACELTAADARTTLATASSHRAAGDGDVFAAAVLTAADARTILASGSSHRAAGDGDGFGAFVLTAADARTIFASGGLQAAGFFIIVLIIVLQGQRACGGFFKARAGPAAFQLVIAVQLDLHIALSLNAQGGFSFFTSPWDSGVLSGVAHIDLYVFQGELQRRGSVVDHRNGVAPKAIIFWVH